MFANCMQTVDYTPLYVICLHENANCIYTVYIQQYVNNNMHIVCNLYIQSRKSVMSFARSGMCVNIFILQGLTRTIDGLEHLATL